VFALGGVGLSNIDEVVSAGAAGVAMISAILAAADVESAVSEIAGCLRRAHSAENFSKKEG
jgi:thiamine monophosphate synthase